MKKNVCYDHKIQSCSKQTFSTFLNSDELYIYLLFQF